MKKNYWYRILAAVTVATLITCCFAGGTFAKYTSSASGTDSAQVAKWDVTVNGTQIATTGTAPTVSFDLFNTIKDTDKTAETDVKANMIAPGTTGSFDLVIANNSDVNAKYDLTLAITGATGVNLEFSTDGTTWTTDLASLSKTATAINMGTNQTVTVQWRWAYYTSDAQDKTDTAAGIAAGTVTVTATIAVTQVD